MTAPNSSAEPFPRPEPPVLPDRSRDDTDENWAGPGGETVDDDERFLSERPPHWQ